jgi:hypothetical protein
MYYYCYHYHHLDITRKYNPVTTTLMMTRMTMVVEVLTKVVARSGLRMQ